MRTLLPVLASLVFWLTLLRADAPYDAQAALTSTVTYDASAALEAATAPTTAYDAAAALVAVQRAKAVCSPGCRCLECLAGCQCKDEACADDSCTCGDGYDKGYKRAVKEGKVLLLWVGQDAKPVAGCVSVRVDGYKRAASPGVVIGIIDSDGELSRFADIAGTPSAETIRAVLTPKKQEVPPTYFAPQYVPQAFAPQQMFSAPKSGGSC